LRVFEIEREGYLRHHPCRFLLARRERPTLALARLIYLTTTHDTAVATDQRAVPMSTWMRHPEVGKDVHRRANEIFEQNPNTMRAWLQEAESKYGLSKEPDVKAAQNPTVAGGGHHATAVKTTGGEPTTNPSKEAGVAPGRFEHPYQVEWNADDPAYWRISEAVPWATDQFRSADLEEGSRCKLEKRWSQKKCGEEIRKAKRGIHFMTQRHRTKVHKADFMTDIRREISQMKSYDADVSSEAEKRLEGFNG